MLKLILLFGNSFDCSVKVIKFLYDVSKISNHWFVTYHTYYKDKLGIIESIYNLCFLYSFNSFGIVEMQTNDTLILADNDFTSTEKDAIRSVKIMIKNTKYLIFAHPLKFNGAYIKINLNRIVLKKESYLEGICLVIDYVADIISFRGITRKKLSPKE